MRDHDFTGRCNMNTRSRFKKRMRDHFPKKTVEQKCQNGIFHATNSFFCSLLFASTLFCSAGVLAEEYPSDAVELDAESGQKIEEPGVRRDWRLDSAVFTEISPVTAAEIAIKLPEDQREED